MINWLLALINTRQKQLYLRNCVLEKENAALKDEIGRLNAAMSRRKRKPFHLRFLYK